MDMQQTSALVSIGRFFSQIPLTEAIAKVERQALRMPTVDHVVRTTIQASGQGGPFRTPPPIELVTTRQVRSPQAEQILQRTNRGAHWALGITAAGTLFDAYSAYQAHVHGNTAARNAFGAALVGDAVTLTTMTLGRRNLGVYATGTLIGTAISCVGASFGSILSMNAPTPKAS